MDDQPHTFQGECGLTKISGVTYRQLYDIVRRKLDYFHPDRSDPDAFCQDMCCQVEKAQGIYPNMPELVENSGIEERKGMRYPIIMNGDHIEFELEHANKPPKERSDWPLPSFNALDWAEAFREKGFVVHRDDKPLDDQDGFMIGWFANALMRGFYEHASRASDPSPE